MVTLAKRVRVEGGPKILIDCENESYLVRLNIIVFCRRFEASVASSLAEEAWCTRKEKNRGRTQILPSINIFLFSWCIFPMRVDWTQILCVLVRKFKVKARKLVRRLKSARRLSRTACISIYPLMKSAAIMWKRKREKLNIRYRKGMIEGFETCRQREISQRNLNGLCHDWLVLSNNYHFAASYASARNRWKLLLVNDKITALCQTKKSLKHLYQTLQTNEFWKTVRATTWSCLQKLQ